MIIDVRTKEEYEGGHVGGAINIPVTEIREAKIPFDLEENVEVYCSSGARAEVARGALIERGFINVDLYNDGKYQ